MTTGSVFGGTPPSRQLLSQMRRRPCAVAELLSFGKKTLTISGHGQNNVHMKAITYTAARESLASTMDQVCVDHEPVIITRNRDQAVVMMSLEDYESLQETAYLLRSPANARRLLDSISELKGSGGITKSLDELTK